MMNTIQKIGSPSVEPLAVIERILAELELSADDKKKVQNAYGDVSEVLSRAGSPIEWFLPDIRPQGSVRIGTTIPPIGRNQFDLDVLCCLRGTQFNAPDRVYEQVWDALGISGSPFKARRTRKNRCIRIHFPETRAFYLDVTPAIPNGDFNGLLVPDRKLQEWAFSDPIGFADSFFKPTANTLPDFPVKLMANDRRGTMMASVEPLPEQTGFRKTPLQRIVQMEKRHRDEHFQNDQEHRPTSIIVTTLTTHSYKSALAVPSESLFEFICRVVAGLPNHILSTGKTGERKFTIPNPVNPSENFAEKWIEENYNRFLVWHTKLIGWLRTLHQQHGIDALLKKLIEGLGKEPVLKAATGLGRDTDTLHQSGRLVVTQAASTSAAVIAPKTTFYGRR